MNKDLLAIFEYLEREKGITRELIVKSIEDALVVAARKGQKGMVNIDVKVNPKTGEIKAATEKEVVDVVEYPAEEISLVEAREYDDSLEIGDWVEIEVLPETFGRVAAQVARQLISQKIRGAEREVIYEEYRHRIGEIISGTVRRVTKGHTLIVDLGKVEAILPGRFYPKLETYHIGERVLALLYDVQDTENGGAEVILSRSHPEFVTALFMQEVPEIGEGIIEIKKIVREAGFRTKMAVISNDSKIDPVGACVGVRGNRVKNIIRELNSEKIDVLPYSDDPFMLLKNSISPCEIKKAEFDEEEDLIRIIVDDEDYPSVLGRKGTNARLTAELVGLKVEIHKASEYKKQIMVERKQLSLLEEPILDEPITSLNGINQLIFENVRSSGLDTARKILSISSSEIASQADISLEMAEQILDEVVKLVPKQSQGT